VKRAASRESAIMLIEEQCRYRHQLRRHRRNHSHNVMMYIIIIIIIICIGSKSNDSKVAHPLLAAKSHEFCQRFVI
jgi:hypothetical protein